MKYSSVIAGAALVLFAFAGTAEAQQSVSARVTCYAPGGGGIQGGFSTSRPGPNGGAYPRTLDDFRLGRSNFVTLAANPSRYGQWYDMGSITYVSNLDNRRYTIDRVIGYVHDTGCAFMVPGQSISCCSRFNTCSLAPRKFDIAYGDFRQGSNIGLIHSSPTCGNRDATWTQIGGPMTTTPRVTGGENVGDQYGKSNAPPALSPSSSQYTPTYSSQYAPTYSSQPSALGGQASQYFSPASYSTPGAFSPISSALSPVGAAPSPYDSLSVADRLLALLREPSTTSATTTTRIVAVIGGDVSVLEVSAETIAHDSVPSSLSAPGSDMLSQGGSPQNTFISPDLAMQPPVAQNTVSSAISVILNFLTDSLLRILDALSRLFTGR